MKPTKKEPAKMGQPIIHGGEVADTFVSLRAPASSKAAYKAAAQAKDKTISVWAVGVLDKAAGVKR